MLKWITNIAIIIIHVSSISAQNIANYIGNGSFETLQGNCNVINLSESIFWNSIDSIHTSAGLFSYCNGQIPNQFNTIYQLPQSGDVFAGATFYYYAGINNGRQYLKNRLKKKLIAGNSYCVKFYVNIMNTSTLGSDGFGMYFGDNSIDTITQIYKPLTFLSPQVQSPNGIPIIDTLGWTAVTGTFVANGNEKYALIGMFKPSGSMDTVILNPSMLPLNFTDACIDDVSCIPFDLPAYAGPDKNCIVGDSVFIGREPDVEIDESCVWYHLNTNGTLSAPIQTIAGLYVKPTYTNSSETETFVVRQQLWCSGVKWDTVLVHRDFVGLGNLNAEFYGIEIYPNPAGNNLQLKFNKALALEKISFLDVLGKQCLVIELPKTEIDISSLQKGLYYMHVETKAGNGMFKVVKE